MREVLAYIDGLVSVIMASTLISGVNKVENKSLNRDIAKETRVLADNFRWQNVYTKQLHNGAPIASLTAEKLMVRWYE